jgi:lipoprotein-releasing system permease protein
MISMIIFAVQKRREIGMIRALGASTPQVVGIFSLQGMIIGLIGVVTGVIAGKTFLHFRNEIRAWLSSALHIEVFPTDVYGLSELPSYLRPSDLVIICSVAWVLCALAAFLPSLFTCMNAPAKELRGGAQ